VAVIPGVGYGVVFGECLAAQTARRIPDATSLRLSFATETEGRSRAATLSIAGALVRGGLQAQDGELRNRSIAFSTWRAPNSQPSTTRFAAMPIAELVAAQRSTGGTPIRPGGWVMATLNLLTHAPRLTVSGLTAAFNGSALPGAIGGPGTTAVRVPNAGHLPDIVRSSLGTA
jgi:hypothetical protein